MTSAPRVPRNIVLLRLPHVLQIAYREIFCWRSLHEIINAEIDKNKARMWIWWKMKSEKSCAFVGTRFSQSRVAVSTAALYNKQKMFEALVSFFVSEKSLIYFIFPTSCKTRKILKWEHTNPASAIIVRLCNTSAEGFEHRTVKIDAFPKLFRLAVSVTQIRNKYLMRNVSVANFFMCTINFRFKFKALSDWHFTNILWVLHNAKHPDLCSVLMPTT